MRKKMGVKKRVILISTLICVTICGTFFIKSTGIKDYILVTAIPISEITEKSCSENCYLTVLPEKFFLDERNLPYKTLTVRTTRSIYNKVYTGQDFIGITVRITLPYDQSNKDFEMILKEQYLDSKEQYLDSWEIIGVVTKDNIAIAYNKGDLQWDPINN